MIRIEDEVEDIDKFKEVYLTEMEERNEASNGK